MQAADFNTFTALQGNTAGNVQPTAYYPQNDAGMVAQQNNLYTQHGAYENGDVEASMFEDIDTEVGSFLRDLGATSTTEFSPDDRDRDRY